MSAELAVLAAIDESAASRFAAQGFIVLIFAAGIAKCFTISQRPRTNKKSAIGLMLVLIGWLCGSVLGLTAAGASGLFAAVVGLFGSVATLALVTTGAVLAGLGLAEIRREPRRYNQGFKQAIWTFILGGGVLSMIFIGAMIGLLRTHQVPPSIQEKVQPVAGEVLKFTEENFIFRPPGSPWVRADAKRLAPQASLVFVRPDPEIYFMVIVAPTGTRMPRPLSETVDFFKAAIEVRATNPRWVGELPKTVGGIPGMLLFNRAGQGASQVAFVHWVTEQGGRLYQFTAWAPVTAEDTLRREAEFALSGFSLIDRNSVAALPVGQEEITLYRSPRNKYTVHLPAGWQKWSGATQFAPEAEFGAHYGPDTCVLTEAVHIEDPDADYDTLLQGVARVLEIPLARSSTRQIQSNGVRGSIIEYTRNFENVDYLHRHVILRVGDLVFDAHGWTSDPQKVPVLAEVINGITLENGTGAGTVEMTPAERSVCGLILNDMGIAYLDRTRQPGKATTCFQQAAACRPDDPQMAENLAIAYSRNDQPRLARVAISRAIERFPNHLPLRVQAAIIEDTLGDPKAAAGIYADVFQRGYKDDSAFGHYISLLMRQDSSDEALTAVRKYRQQSESRVIAVTEANILSRKGSHDQAIALLKSLRQGAEFDPRVSYALGQQYNLTNRYPDALTIASELLAHGFNTPDTYMLQADALAGQKNYREAKSTLELALQKDPGDADAREMMRHVSAMLGEGESNLVKQPIDPVPLPPQALADLPDTVPPDAADAGAYYITRFTSTVFDPGNDYRTTDYRKIKILNRTGVEMMSTFQFGFDPLYEAMYVNRVRVTDASGHLVETGKTEDSYVLDAPSHESASQDKVLHVPISGLTPGCTLEFIVTRKYLFAPNQIEFKRHYFSGMLPTLRSGYMIKSALNRFAYSESGPVKQIPIDGGLCWIADNPAPIKGESLQPDLSTFLPILTIGDQRSSWQDIGDEYLNQIKDFTSDDPQCRELATQLTAGKTETEQKLAALIDYVQGQFAYKALEFGRRARIPQKASQIIRNKYGDCKDHALLLYQLLRGAGFDARLVLVNAETEIDRKIPSMDQFNHMIACIRLPDGKYRFLDCTDKDDQLLAAPPAGLDGKLVLVLQQGASELVRIPEIPPDSSLLASDRQLTLQPQGDVQVHETTTITGPAVGYWRSYMRTTRSEDRAKALQQAFASTGLDVQITQMKVSHIDEPREPLVFEITYTLRGRFGRVQDSLVGTVPACWERYWLVPVSGGERVSPFEVKMPLKFQGQSTLHLPAGMKLATALPGNAQLSTQYGSVKADFRSSDGEIRWNTVVRTNTGRYEPAAYPEFEQSRQNLVNSLEPSLTMQAR